MITETLRTLQNEVKVGKGQFNSFGKYKYRSCEQALAEIKKVIQEKQLNVILTINDEIVEMGGKLFVKATATLMEKEEKIETSAFAQMDDHKGMSMEQATGTASSYARKYALGGMFLFDDNVDVDSLEPQQNVSKEVKATIKEALNKEQADKIRTMLAKLKYKESAVQKTYGVGIDMLSFEQAKDCIAGLQKMLNENTNQ